MASPRHGVKAFGVDLFAAGDAFSEAAFADARESSCGNWREGQRPCLKSTFQALPSAWKKIVRFPAETRLAASLAAKTGKPRLYRERKSRPVRGLTKRRCGILGKFLLSRLRPLNLEFVEQKRRTGHTEPNRLGAILDRRRGSGGDEIAAQGADVEISEDAASNEFFMRIVGPA